MDGYNYFGLINFFTPEVHIFFNFRARTSKTKIYKLPAARLKEFEIKNLLKISFFLKVGFFFLKK